MTTTPWPNGAGTRQPVADDSAYLRAEYVLRHGDASAALEVARAALATSPADPGLRCVEAVALAHLGHRDEAEAAVEAVLKAAPRDARTLLARVEIDLWHGNRPPNTLLRARRATRLVPNSAEAYRWYGAAFLQSGEMVAAGEKLRQALSIDPTHAGALADLAVVERWEAAFEGRLGAAAEHEVRVALLRKRLHSLLQIVMMSMLVTFYAYYAYAAITGMSARYAALFVFLVGPVLALHAWIPIRAAGGSRAWELVRSVVRTDRLLAQQCGSLAAAIVLFAAASFAGQWIHTVLSWVGAMALLAGVNLVRLPGYKHDPAAIGAPLHTARDADS